MSEDKRFEDKVVLIEQGEYESVKEFQKRLNEYAEHFYKCISMSNRISFKSFGTIMEYKQIVLMESI
jgi:hypothetical protein